MLSCVQLVILTKAWLLARKLKRKLRSFRELPALLNLPRILCHSPLVFLQPLDRDQPNGRPQWRFTVFAQDEHGEGLVGYADVQVNLKDINDNAPTFPQGVYFGNVTENGTAGTVRSINVFTWRTLYDGPRGDFSKIHGIIFKVRGHVTEEFTKNIGGWVMWYNQIFDR